VPTRCTRSEAGPAHLPTATPLSSELWHCTAYPGLHKKCEAGSHLGSTLKPGRAVLTLGVFRRSRSVAYIHADASPSEVLAPAIVPSTRSVVNLERVDDARWHSLSQTKIIVAVDESGESVERAKRAATTWTCRRAPRASATAPISSSHAHGVGVEDHGVSRYLLSGRRRMGNDGGTETVAGSGKAVTAWGAASHRHARHAGHALRPGYLF